eukprot:jgi/Ulvmu1/5565/UM023_0102.1
MHPMHMGLFCWTIATTASSWSDHPAMCSHQIVCIAAVHAVALATVLQLHRGMERDASNEAGLEGQGSIHDHGDHDLQVPGCQALRHEVANSSAPYLRFQLLCGSATDTRSYMLRTLNIIQSRSNVIGECQNTFQSLHKPTPQL